MAEFLTMEDAKSKFGTKGKTNAALTLGIIGTSLAALGGMGSNGLGSNGGGLLGNLLGFGGGDNSQLKAVEMAILQG